MTDDRRGPLWRLLMTECAGIAVTLVFGEAGKFKMVIDEEDAEVVEARLNAPVGITAAD